MCQRLLIEIMQHVFQFFVSRPSPRPSRSEASSIGLTQCGYECIAVLFADFAILISMAAIEPHVLWHNDFLGSMGEGSDRPPVTGPRLMPVHCRHVIRASPDGPAFECRFLQFAAVNKAAPSRRVPQECSSGCLIRACATGAPICRTAARSTARLRPCQKRHMGRCLHPNRGLPGETPFRGSARLQRGKAFFRSSGH